jgi:hypothetical protein
VCDVSLWVLGLADEVNGCMYLGRGRRRRRGGLPLLLLICIRVLFESRCCLLCLRADLGRVR